jgi:hypothetical protein
VLVALGLIAYLLFRVELGNQARVIVIAALGYYALRLWMIASRARRNRRQGEAGEGG